MSKRNNHNQKRCELTCDAFQFVSGLLFWMVSLTAVPALADTPQLVSTHATQNHIVSGVTTQTSLQERAKKWGLTTQSFKRYRWLMKNTPSGHWYPDLDPAEVLALNTKDPKAMQHYAIIQARNMHARVTRELAFNRLYAKAYRQLYPHEKPIMSPDDQHWPSVALQSGDRVWLFVGVHTPLGRFVYQHLIKTVLATPNTVLDIYFVGKQVSQHAIETWAATIGIPPTMINQRVTLNYGNRRLQQVTNGKKPNLPFVGIVHQSHFQPINLSSVL